MLWLCISLPQLPLEALRLEESDELVVVTACEANARWVVCCNTAAERAGLRVGMSYATALAIRNDLSMLERKPQAEKSALERLAAWAYQFSSTVIIGEAPPELQRARTAAIWLEIGASLKLFGGFRNFVEYFESDLMQLQYTYRLGIGPTLEGAGLLARAGIRVALTTTQALYARIRPRPVSELAISPQVIDKLQMVGIRTIGAAVEIPREEIARRFGPETSNYFDRLLGLAPDPRERFELPPHYTARFELGFEIASTEALLFPVRRMMREFCGFLCARDTAVQRFRLAFVHRGHMSTELTIGLSAPERNSERLFAIVRERLERICLPAPTIELALAAREFAAPMALQTDLLNGTFDQQEALSHTIDRIAARVGNQCVHGIRTVPDHRPEASWRTAAPNEPNAPAHRFAERPLWLLPEPKLLQSSTLPIQSGPERIESGWWEDSDVRRDYYLVRTNSGADLWVFRDLRDSNWYLHGFWA